MNASTNENASTALARVVTDLDLADAAQLRSAFEQMFAQADEWVARAKGIVVTSEDQKHEMRLARESRLALKDIRVNAEKTRKRLKENALRYGKAVDGVANIVKALIQPIEEHLLEQETFAERAAQARRDALRDARATALRALGTDPSTYADLGAMGDDTWDSVRATAEAAKAQREEEARRAEAVRIEAERIEAKRREDARQAAVKAEAERVAREKEIADENARLKAEAEEREKAVAAERAKAAADAEARELAARAERERAEKAERELAAERERKAKEERDRQAEEARRAAAPDREKLAAFAEQLRALTLPAMTTARGQEIATGAQVRLQKLATQIDEAAAAMGSNTEAAE